MAIIGGVVGIFVVITDEVLKSKGSTFRTPVLAVAVGIYLPLELSTAILVGGLIAHFAARIHAKRGVDGEKSMRHGMLFAAGLITGEALVGILMAIPIVQSGDADVFALGESMQFGGTLGLVVVGLVSVWMYRVAAAKQA